MNPRALLRTLALLVVLAAAVAWLWPNREDDKSAAALPSAPQAVDEIRDPSVERASPAAESDSIRESPGTTATETPRPRRVRVLDERTGEPLPHFAFTLEPGAIVGITGADGSAELPASAPLRCELLSSENPHARPDRIQTRPGLARDLPPSFAVELDGSTGAAPLDIRLPVGPTYSLALTLPAGHLAEELELELTCADPSQRFDHVFASLRDPLDPWIRFRATATLVQGGPPWRLHARTPDGLWAASAPVEQNLGVAKERVPLLLESHARLVGVVRDRTGAALADGYVGIERDGATIFDENNHRLLGLIEADGRYTIPCVPPGDYTVKLDRDGFLPFRARVALAAGATTEFELVLEKPSPSASGRVEARLESATGRFEGVVYPYLRPAGTKSGSRRAAVKWNDEHGARVGQLVFEDVPLGDWDLGLQVPGFVQLEQREQRVRPHDPPLVFRILDDIWTLAPLDILALDEQGSALDGFLAVLSVKSEWGEASARERAESGRAHLAAAPVGVRARLKLTKDGWQPHWSEVDLAAQARELRITLKPGWGIEVVVRGPDGTGLRGAKVFFDGELAGETDSDGLLFVARTATPATASVEYLDWVRAEKSGLDAEGRFQTFEPWLVVALQPPAR